MCSGKGGPAVFGVVAITHGIDGTGSFRKALCEIVGGDGYGAERVGGDGAIAETIIAEEIGKYAIAGKNTIAGSMKRVVFDEIAVVVAPDPVDASTILFRIELLFVLITPIVADSDTSVKTVSAASKNE